MPGGATDVAARGLDVEHVAFDADNLEQVVEAGAVLEVEEAQITGQLGAQLHVVVDLPIEHDDEAAIARHHGLMAGGAQVDDRKTPMSEHDVASLDR